MTDPALSIRPIDLAPYTDASALSVRDHFSLHRAYMIFRTMGLRHMIVTDGDNQVAGILTRRDLMDFRLHDVLHPHSHGEHHGHGGHGPPESQGEHQSVEMKSQDRASA